MPQLILALFILLPFLSYTPSHVPEEVSSEVSVIADSAPVRVNKELIAELTRRPVNKTWRDSGYYFQLNTIDWIARGVRENGAGQVTGILVSFRSADPSAVNFTGRAVFRPLLDSFYIGFPKVSAGDVGTAVVAFPQDLVLCPSPMNEIGFGQNEIDLPLFLQGEITGIGSAVFNDTILVVSNPTTVQLGNFEIQD